MYPRNNRSLYARLKISFNFLVPLFLLFQSDKTVDLLLVFSVLYIKHKYNNKK